MFCYLLLSLLIIIECDTLSNCHTMDSGDTGSFLRHKPWLSSLIICIEKHRKGDHWRKTFLVLYKAVLTCAVTSPACSLGKSVCDQGLLDHGSTLRRSSPNGKSRSRLCRNFLIFHGKSLWLEHKQMMQD